VFKGKIAQARRIIMKQNAIFLCAILIITFCIPRTSYAKDVKHLINKGLRELKTTKGDPNLCVITDASYVMINNKSTEDYIDTIQEETGCSIGRGNLLLLHRPENYPLKIVIYRKDIKECVSIHYDGKKATYINLGIDPSKTFKPEAWENTKKGLGASDAFTIVGLANAWAAGAPYDFFQCVEFHNHICPGIISGYLIAKYIAKKYPLKTGEKYTFISCPEWCKDDAIQVLLDLTPGKKNMYVKSLSDVQKNMLLDSTVAGILVIENRVENEGTAFILNFNWKEETSGTSGDKISDPNHRKLQTILNFIHHLNKPENFVHVLKQYDLSADKLKRLTIAGINPYEELGFIKKNTD
jgi:formylmethanofuran dehydrogenase subunit E-like metal-binding protein